MLEITILEATPIPTSPANQQAAYVRRFDAGVCTIGRTVCSAVEALWKNMFTWKIYVYEVALCSVDSVGGGNVMEREGMCLQ